MGESMSRYSIVERLTNKKLNLLDEKAMLSQEITETANDIEIMEKDLVNWEDDALQDLKREKEDRLRLIEKEKHKLTNLQKFKSEKENNYNEKIGQLDKAMESITEISKEAGQ